MKNTDTPIGAGMYLWNLSATADGDIAKTVAMAKYLKLNHVSIKIQDGIAPYNVQGQQARLKELIPALKEVGLKVWGWGYIYGNKWFTKDGAAREADMTVKMCKLHDVDGFHMDAEHEYFGQFDAAKIYTTRVRTALPDLPLGLSTYRFPSYFPKFPWNEFLRVSSHHYVQLYWERSHNPGAQLKRSHAELTALKNLPYIPVIPAYSMPADAKKGYKEWRPTPADYVELFAEMRRLKLPGVSAWSMQHIEHFLNLTEAFATHGFPPAKKEAPKPPAPKYPPFDEANWKKLIDQARKHGWEI